MSSRLWTSAKDHPHFGSLHSWHFGLVMGFWFAAGTSLEGRIWAFIRSRHQLGVNRLSWMSALLFGEKKEN